MLAIGNCDFLSIISATFIDEKLSGTPYGSPGDYNGEGNTFEKAWDGNISTFVDNSDSGQLYTCLDLSLPYTIQRIKYAPRFTWPGAFFNSDLAHCHLL